MGTHAAVRQDGRSDLPFGRGCNPIGGDGGKSYLLFLYLFFDFARRLNSLNPAMNTDATLEFSMQDAGLKTEVQKAPHGSLSDHERRSPEVPVSINNSSYLDFETLLYQLSGLVKAAEGIGGDVCLASGIFVDAFRREKVVVEAILRCKKPSNPSELMAILAPVAEKVSQLGDFSKNPKSVQSGEAAHPLHLRVLEEATQSLNWVAYSGPNCGMCC